MLTINHNFDFEINSNSEDLSASINSSTTLTQEPTLGLLKNYLHRKIEASVKSIRSTSDHESFPLFIFLSYNFLTWVYTIKSCKDFNLAQVVCVAFDLAGD